MAARKTQSHLQRTREKIQASQLINRLENHALGQEEIMTTSQVNAAKILIGKVIPDMKAVEVSTGNGHEEWLKLLEDSKK